MRIAQYNPLQYLPFFEELPDSDDTAVDNELQVLNDLEDLLGTKVDVASDKGLRVRDRILNEAVPL